MDAVKGSSPSRVRFLVAYALAQWPTLAAIAGLMLSAAGLAALLPLPMKLLVDFGLRGAPLPAWASEWLGLAGLSSQPEKLIVIASVLGIGLAALQSCVEAALAWAWTIAGQRMVNSLTGDLF